MEGPPIQILNLGSPFSRGLLRIWEVISEFSWTRHLFTVLDKLELELEDLYASSFCDCIADTFCSKLLCNLGSHKRRACSYSVSFYGHLGCYSLRTSCRSLQNHSCKAFTRCASECAAEGFPFGWMPFRKFCWYLDQSICSGIDAHLWSDHFFNSFLN